MKVQQAIEAAILERQVLATAAVQANDYDCPEAVLKRRSRQLRVECGAMM